MALFQQRNRIFSISMLALCCSATALALPQSTLTAYTAHLEALRSLVQSCRSNAAACDANTVGSDEQVHLAGLNSGANVDVFEAHYDWLREVLGQAHDPAMKDRADKLNAAASRIQDSLDDAQGHVSDGNATDQFHHARADADAILRHPEFVTVSGTSFWDRVMAHIALWIDSLFNNVAMFGRRSPWIGPVFEWGLIALAGTGLFVWAMRVLRRQRLKVRIEAGRQIEPCEEASRNWRALAAEQAARADWREAVHCLYWATIVMLEGRRFWAPNRSRTPREYVRLLEAGSPGWSLLRQQTLGFERIWYGLQAAEPGDYQRALDAHEQLRTV
ncbi:hypothetical protein HNQ77_002997 [Silvibacterium bohemicum]|uniref:Protein-glutamine gamma-glutamyltransferase-like C-terminal domain-containing protein n=1 Tax=Silvibacterium bohemicum TaxID=1577686 RepID=A0A841K1I1_9BACT|nr:DUF4129 domain-containing protein [Silvibacterium bohemicum]MBB6145041.1 hypothetical protein [Silvibacterium bohemicum]